ncbi:MAG: FG-GAP-like repeat-containing protein, partial [Planctomycetes bacterium]|nr:FG-GAP-like repeat-containing protein [Planctomycetota bacterium]
MTNSNLALAAEGLTANTNNNSLTDKSSVVSIDSSLVNNDNAVFKIAASTPTYNPNFRTDKVPVKTTVITETNKFDGALVYSYPIVTPPGRNGMEPNLKLTYSSQNSAITNFFGYGWDISIPFIERINKKGTDKLYNSSDAYFNSSLTGELKNISGAEYGSKVDNGEFLKYTFVNNEYWQVKDKAGKIYIFGQYASARQDNPSDTTKVYKWMLESITDTNGNYVKYLYYKNSGQIYPQYIKYTGNGANEGIFEVEFLRESRNDVIKNYSTGFEVITNYRVSEIQTKINGSWVRKYQINYAIGDNDYRSLINYIVENGKDENGTTATLLKQVFSYQKKARAFTESTGMTPPISFTYFSSSYPSVDQVVDVNGDGLADILNCGLSSKGYINKGDGTGWQESSVWRPPSLIDSSWHDNGTRMVDVNSDGLVDFVQAYYDNYNSLLSYVFLNTGNGWVYSSDWSLPVGFIKKAPNGYWNDNGVRLGDVNGDGFIDLVQSLSYEYTYTQKVFLNDPVQKKWIENTSFVLPPLYFTMLYQSTPQWTYTDPGTRLMDLNSDGLADIIRSERYSQSSYLNKGNGTWVQTNLGLPYISSGGKDIGARFEDINSDGLVDYVKSSDNSPYDPYVDVSLNTGSDFRLDNTWQGSILKPFVLSDGR